MQKQKFYLQMLNYTVVSNYGIFQTYLHYGKTLYIAFQEPDELLVPVYGGCKIVSE